MEKVRSEWEILDRDRVAQDPKDGRLKILGRCRCGSPVWLKRTRFFKSLFSGVCPSCGRPILARVKIEPQPFTPEDAEESRIKDVELLAAHCVDVAVRDMDPVLYDAAMMLLELNEKHWSECWQIGVYSDGIESEKDE